MRLHVETSYTVTAHTEFDVPFDSWSDVEEWFIKWNILNYRLKGETEFHEYDLGDVDVDGMDVKRPSLIFIAEVDSDGVVNMEAPFVDQE
jgi:hypothetical protein